MRKAQALATRTIVILILLLVVLVVMVYIFRTYIGKEAAIIGEQLESFGDCDCDGVTNFLDKCPCIEFEQGYENIKYDGCPQGTEPTDCDKEQCEQAKQQYCK